MISSIPVTKIMVTGNGIKLGMAGIKREGLTR
jgi:hypothetical protein